MVQTTTLAEQLLEVIAQHPGSGLDELVMLCPDYTWNQIFLEVDHLSRCGHLQLVQISPGRYAVSVLTHWRFYAPQSREARLSLRNLTQSQQDGQYDRCGGLMVWQSYDKYKGWRCILCGEIIDPVILAQRQSDASDL